MSGDYPISLDVRSCRIVIVGGGAVAARKAVGLLAAGATQVVVVSPTFDAKMPSDVQRIAARFEPAHLNDARLVFAATNSPAVNATVVRVARERNLFVSRADADTSEEPGDFTGLAVHRNGPITLAVSAAGNPAIAARLRDEMACLLPPRWIELARLAALWRPLILKADVPAEIRTAALRKLAEPAAADQLEHNGPEAIRRVIENVLGHSFEELRP